MIPIDRIRDHVADLARQLASIEVAYAALRGQIERARLLADGLAAAIREQ